jgi:serine/threonine protein phosphatase PrpC
MKYRNHSITNVGKVRSANEDNFGDAITPNGHLFVVCDGMGGHVGGAKASSIAVASITEYFMREQYGNVIQAIDRALSFANEQIFASALSEPELKGMGTTAVVLIVSGNDCFIGHVGDSRIYLKSNNKLHRITKDHSFVQTLVDSGVISDDEAESHPNKNQILKALGTSSVVEGTISQMPIQVKTGDVFLLCSDGLNGMVNDKGIEMMLQGNNLQQAGDDLIRAALDAGGNDNVTATIVAIDESVYSKSNFVDFNPVKKFDGASTQTYTAQPVSNKTVGGVLFSAKGIALIGTVVVLFAVIGYFLMSGGDASQKPKGGAENEGDTTEISTPTETNSGTSVDRKTDEKTEVDSKKDKKTKVIGKNAITKWPYPHEVQPKESLTSISKDFNEKYNLNLIVEDIIDFNKNKSNNPNLKELDRDALDDEKIKAGIILMIPKIEKNK